MLPAHRTYLRLIKDDLENTLLPAAGTDFARLIAEVSSGLLARMLVEDSALPQARQEALVAFHALLPELQHVLDGSFYRSFEQALALAPESWEAFETVLHATMRELLKGGVATSACASRVVAIDFTLREKVEAAYRAEFTPASATQEPKTETFTQPELDKLQAWLRRHFPAEQALRIVDVKRLAGGASKLTMLLHFEGNVELPASLVMRRDRELSSYAASVASEYPLLRALSDLGVAVPQPFGLDADGEVLGAAFVLLAHLPGRNIGDFIQIAEPDPEVALDYGRVLARLHSVPVAPVASLVKQGERPTRDRVQSEIEEFERDWKTLPRRSFIMDCAYDWLKQNMHLADGQRSLVHRDVGAHNMLVADRRVTALLDWERCTTGNPAEDLGCIYYMIGQMIAWDDFLPEYERTAGFRVPREQIDFYTLWGSVRLVTMITKANVPILEGRLKHLQLAYSGEHFVQRLLHRVSGKLAAILKN